MRRLQWYKRGAAYQDFLYYVSTHYLVLHPNVKGE